MNGYRTMVLILIVLSLLGCSSVNYKTNLQQASICCNGLSEIKYRPLTYDEPVKASIGVKDSPARLFDEEKSFFLAINLPPYQGAYEVQIQSTPVNQKLFLPNGLLLDEAYRVLKKIPVSAFVRSNGTASHSFFVNKDEGFRYLVLYTTNSAIGMESESRNTGVSVTPIVAGSVTYMYSSGTDMKATITAAEGGDLTVQAKKYRPVTIEP